MLAQPKRSSTLNLKGTSGLRFFPAMAMPRNLPKTQVAIADMANIFGVTHRTLHFYEEKRLLIADRMGAMRVYGDQQVRMMALINLCRETGMAIATIQELVAELREATSQEEADTIFREGMVIRRRELLATESQLRRQMQQIAQILEDDEANDNDMPRTPFLTEQERSCLELMAEGYTPLRISNTTDRTIDEVLAIEASVIRKFGSSNRFQAVAKAVILGLIGD